MPHVEVLGDNTGIGSREGIGGIPWKDLKQIAFDLIDKGFIRVVYVNGKSTVNIEKLESIEIKLGKEVLDDFKSVQLGKKLSPLKKMKLNGKLLGITRDRIVTTEDHN